MYLAKEKRSKTKKPKQKGKGKQDESVATCEQRAYERFFSRFCHLK